MPLAEHPDVDRCSPRTFHALHPPREQVMRHIYMSSIAACIVGLTATSSALAANECQVRYSYANSPTSSAQTSKYIDAGKTINIPSAQGQHVLYVENRKNHKIRVYRTGIGQHVDLNHNGRDPQIGNYPPGVTLQKVSCLSASQSGSASPTPVQQLVDAAFQSVQNTTVPHLNQLNSWRSSVQQWAQKTASDWGSCPSNGAQTSYNQAKTWRNQVNSSLQQAEQIRAEAGSARNACLASTNNNALCGSTYNTLPVHVWISSLTSARNSLTAAINTMAALQCPSGCARTARVTVPTVKIQPGGAYRLSNPGWLDLPVCTKLSLGSVGFNPSAVSSGNLGRIVQAQPPACTSTANLRVCTNVDVRVLLPTLQRLSLVPPNVGAIQLDVPTRNVTAITGVQPASCQKPLRVCAPSGNVTVSLNEGQNLFNASASCSNHVTLGCQQPPFGLQPATQQVGVPDLTKATVRWTRPRPGSIRVDLTRPEFKATCAGAGRGISIPKPPIVSMGTNTVQLPFICTQMNMVRVVANP